jgi:hypothetical protein
MGVLGPARCREKRVVGHLVAAAGAGLAAPF